MSTGPEGVCTLAGCYRFGPVGFFLATDGVTRVAVSVVYFEMPQFDVWLSIVCAARARALSRRCSCGTPCVLSNTWTQRESMPVAQ